MRANAALLAVLLAGCVGAVPDGTDGPAALAVPATIAADRCRELLMFVPVEEAAARAALPQGWEPAAASMLMAPRGSMVVLSAQDCPAANLTAGGAPARVLYHLGWVWIPVEPPEGAPEADLHLYALAVVQQDATIAAALAADGWEVTEGLVALHTERPPAGDARVFDQVLSGEGFEYRARGVYHPPTDPVEPIRVAVWQGAADAPAGMYAEAKAAFGAGHGTWEASAGSPLARIAGAERGSLSGASYVFIEALDLRLGR